MSQPRIVPEVTPLTQPYWAAAAEGRIVVQSCRRCGDVWHPPQHTCPSCLSEGWDWRDAAPFGEIHSYTIVRHAAHRAVADRVPYVVSLVRLDDGPLVLCNVLGCEESALRVGMPVVIAPGPTPGGLELPQAWPREGGVGRETDG